MTNWEELINNLESSIRNDITSKKTLKHLWYVPEDNASKERYNGVMFLGLNSGGEDVRDRDEYEKCTCDTSWYHDDKWIGDKGDPGKSPLQIQVRLLFLYIYHACKNTAFKYDPKLSKIYNIERVESEDDYKKFSRGLLAGNVCPFQSSSLWNLLYPWAFQREDLIDFWKSIFKEHLRSETRVIVVMGDDAFDIVKSAFGKINAETKTHSSGWGKIKIKCIQGEKGKHPTIIVLPHLSRFAIFGREKSLDAIEKIFHRKELFNF